MADDAYGATVAKRQLSRRLTELRMVRGYTANHVCGMLNWGRGKVGRFAANQWRRPWLQAARALPTGSAWKQSAVNTEASLMYRGGSKGDRREQVEHLLDAASRPNVELRIQRFADGPPVGMHSMVNILDFPGEPALVYLETDYVIEEVTNTESENSYIQSFGRAVDAALDPPDTPPFLNTQAEQLHTTTTNLSK